MQIIRHRLSLLVAAASLALLLTIQTQTGTAQEPPAGQSPGGGGGRRGFSDGFGGARGVLGTVTETAADHYTIKTEDGSLYTVHFSVNTRIFKGGGGRRGPGEGRRQDSTGSSGQGSSGQGERQQPQPLKPTDIKVGDIITAGGDVDDAAKSIGAVFIGQIDPERAKEMREMQANFGKTWLAGRVTGIEGTAITIEGLLDHAKHVIEVDENTSFRKRRDSITLADIQPGQQLRAEGGVQAGVFRATTVNAMEPRNREQGPNAPSGPPPSR